MERRVVLAKFQECPRPAAVFGWRCTSAAGADRVGVPWLERQDLLNAQLVLPAVGEVIRIEEAFTDSRPKVGDAYVSGIVAEADPAVMPDAVFAALDNESVQVLIAPAEDELK